MASRAGLPILVALVLGSAWAIAAQIGHDPIPVTTLAIGDDAGDFVLPDVTGGMHSLSGSMGKNATVIYFWSVDCPCVDYCQMRVQTLMDRFRTRGVEWIAVDSHPDDKPADVMAKMGRIHATYLVLLDKPGTVGKRLGGLSATDAVVLDGKGRIRYRGSIDDALKKPTKEYVGPALEAILSGRDPERTETPPYGCPFPGNEGLCPILGK